MGNKGRYGRLTRYDDILGQRFGKLTVKEFTESVRSGARTRYLYLCVCDCGGTVTVNRNKLQTLNTTSCGCMRNKYRKGSLSPHWDGHGEVSGSLWHKIQRDAALRGIPVDVTIQDIWDQFQSQDGLCALTGQPLVLATYSRSRGSRTASLDRIDSAKGYEKGNIQWVHKDFNWMKGKWTPSQFIAMCCLVADHSRKGK